MWTQRTRNILKHSEYINININSTIGIFISGSGRKQLRKDNGQKASINV